MARGRFITGKGARFSRGKASFIVDPSLSKHGTGFVAMGNHAFYDYGEIQIGLYPGIHLHDFGLGPGMKMNVSLILEHFLSSVFWSD